MPTIQEPVSQTLCRGPNRPSTLKTDFDTSTSKKPISPPIISGKKFIVPFTGGGIVLLAALVTSLSSGNETSEVNDANINRWKAAIAKSAEDSHSSIKTLLATDGKIPSKLWNRLDADMLTGDNTLIESLIPIRREIIQEGATNPNIPPWIVHSALYSTAVHAQEISKQLENNNKQIENLTKKSSSLTEEKAKLSKEVNKLREENNALQRQKAKIVEMVPDIMVFVGQDIVDTATVGDYFNKIVRKRHRIFPSEFKEFLKNNPNAQVYKTELSRPFKELAGYVISQIGDMDSFNRSSKTLQTTNNKDTESAMWSIFLNTVLSPDKNVKVPGSVLERAKVEIFGAEQLKPYADLLKQVNDAAKKSPGASREEILKRINEEAKKVQKEKSEGKKPEEKKLPETPTPVSMTLTIPGVPDKIEAGSLGGLSKRLQPFPLMPYHLHKKPEEQEKIALETLMLSRQAGDECKVPVNEEWKYAQSAAIQWFAHKHYSDSPKTGSASWFPRADYIMLQVLAEEATKEGIRGELAFESLGQVMASFPRFGIGVVLGDGNKEIRDIPLRYAHTAVVAALRANPEKAKALIQGIAKSDDKAAPLIWLPPTSEKDIKLVGEIRAIGQKETTKIMAFLVEPNTFREHLLDVVNYSDDQTIYTTALAGLALSEKNATDTLQKFLNIGLDGRKDSDKRSAAFYAFLKATSRNLIEIEIQKRFSDKIGPINYDNARYFTSDEKLKEFSSPFLAFTMQRYENALNWHKAASAFVARKGGQPLTLGEGEKLSILLALEDEELQGQNDNLKNLMNEECMRKKYIPQMVKYLESCKGTGEILDNELAIPIIRVVAKCGALETEIETQRKVQKVLVDIADNPDMYVKEPSKGSHGAKTVAGAVSFISALATQNLGKTIDLSNPDDPAAEFLHIRAGTGASLFEDVALKALVDLGERYEERFKTLGDGKEKDTLSKARKVHADKMFDHMKERKIGPYSESTYNDQIMHQERLYAQVAIKLGGEHAVRKILGRINNKMVEINNHARGDEPKVPRDQYIASWMRALYECGYDPERDNPGLGFNGQANTNLKRVFEFVSKEEYARGRRLSDTSSQADKRKIQTAVVDVGYIPPGILKNKVDYLFPGSIRPEHFVEQHPLIVASALEEAENRTHVLSCHINQELPEDTFRPVYHQDSVVRIYEEIAQGNILGERYIRTVNNSFIYFPATQYVADWNERIYDLVAARIDQLGDVGVDGFFAGAGNYGWVGRASYPLVHTPALGTITNLGIFSEGRKPAQKTFIVTATDPFPEETRVASFSSPGNLQRKGQNKELEDVIVGANGVQVSSLAVINGKVVRVFIDGTSLATPNLTGEANRALLDDLKDSYPVNLRKHFASHMKQIPGVHALRGGNYLDIPGLEIKRQSEQRQHQKILQKK